MHSLLHRDAARVEGQGRGGGFAGHPVTGAIPPHPLLFFLHSTLRTALDDESTGAKPAVAPSDDPHVQVLLQEDGTRAQPVHQELVERGQLRHRTKHTKRQRPRPRWIEATAAPEPLERAKLARRPLEPERTWPARRKILVRPTWYLSSSPTIVSRMSLATSRASPCQRDEWIRNRKLRRHMRLTVHANVRV